MFKKTISILAISTIASVTGITMAQAAKQQCMPIGGLGMPNFVPQPDGTTTIVAPLSGSAATAAGKITAQRKTATGLEMDMEHYFMTEKGGFMYTKDLAVLFPVQGKKDRYMVEITYHIQEGSASGALQGYQGQFKSYGLVDLKNQQGLIRYRGEICR